MVTQETRAPGRRRRLLVAAGATAGALPLAAVGIFAITGTSSTADHPVESVVATLSAQNVAEVPVSGKVPVAARSSSPPVTLTGTAPSSTSQSIHGK
jgi:hypothetical protein